MFTRIALAVLIVIALAAAYFAFSAYTTVQAQVARLTAVEQQVSTAVERMKQIEADVTRLRPPAAPAAPAVPAVPGR